MAVDDIVPPFVCFPRSLRAARYNQVEQMACIYCRAYGVAGYHIRLAQRYVRGVSGSSPDLSTFFPSPPPTTEH